MASLSSTTAPAPRLSPAPPRLGGRFPVRKAMLAVLAAAAFITLATILYEEIWPFSQKSVVRDLAEASDSDISVSSFHQTYFPSPGCVIEGVEFRHGAGHFKLVTIEKLIIEGSYLGILRQHVARITTVRGHVFVPRFGSHTTFNTQHSKTVVDEIVANGTLVEFASEDPSKKPLQFDVHEALLQYVGWGIPLQYKLKFRNPEPPGELDVNGKFGSWVTGNAEQTPISGAYTFDRADLSVYRGIAGMLTSRGKFEGVLKHVNVSGTTDTPDFEVSSGGHKVRLQSQFEAYVDATRGDTFLKHVEARYGRTTVIAEGSIAGSPGRKGKFAQLQLTSLRARIEDILGLFVSHGSPMSGPVSLKTQVEIPPGNEPFLRKVTLKGAFGIDEGTFSKPQTQKDVDELSAGARGQNKEDPETVMTGLAGQVELLDGVARFSDLSFEIPGAKARMHGTYNIITHRIDLHGRMRVDTKISKTEQGVKALLLKIMDPIFKKKKKGEIVPVHIAGTYEKPQFGLDLTQQSDQKQSTK